ncbi:Eco57I restriction-modification methylase domain-containing protein [uncultured Helicobacter sp.]|uniref:Eco57I restriction-modification methylase domain-containing protein n=1 Tax=uncultured Helicobacter sp. TaxID=175537 RepID=UPI001C3AC774|nr:class I SAM-dependent methyltransferase [Candidatus Helicobacter avicola]
MNLNVEHLGQVFTPQHIVSDMLGLIQNTTKAKNPRFLEPSCGDGAFLKHLPKNTIGIELDSKVIVDSKVLNLDFFAYPVSEKFDVVIGNPPYVKYKDIGYETKILLSSFKNIFDERSNLYLFFIYKSILHLKEGGELIFITPRDFLKSTASVRLNEFLFSQGSITDFVDLGDKKIFSKAQPNCAIWRFERGNFSRNTKCLRQFSCINGQLLFTKNTYTIPFSSLFFVKVGAVSGADSIYANEKYGNTDFVYSNTCKSGKTRKMIYGIYGKTCAYLQGYKEQLLKRKIKNFDENNWWEWGRDYYKSDLPRIYVNTKTRNKRPFFLHSCKAYDGSILAIFPKFEVDFQGLKELCEKLNNVDWQELGFICDGRYLFSQRSLESCMLDSNFSKYKWLNECAIM